MIEVQNLSRLYGDFAAVDDVTFGIKSGEVVGLLGHNGAGKTTIMKMITAFIEPSSGQVRVDGVDVQEHPLAVQAEMGYLPENLPLYPELTVADYLTHAAELRGLNPADCLGDAIEATQLNDKAFDRIDTLSRGYKQRLGVAQAILHRPKFLILDEPSNGLDPNQIREMRSLIKRLAEHATVILSTHIMQEVNAVCDRVLILRGGKLVVDERLEDLQRARAVSLRTAAEVDVATLTSNLSGLGSITRSGEGEWSIGVEGNADETIAAIAQALASQNAPIYHLAQAARDLEAVFAEVNEADGEGKDAA